jgi:hypothetical protein
MANAVNQATELLRSVLGKDAQVQASLDDALKASAAEGASGKCWAVIYRDQQTLQNVHKALESGSPRLGLVIAAGESPVSQLEVLRAMEYGNVYTAAAVLEEGKKSPAAVALSEASTYQDGASVVLLATPSVVQGDERWTPFRYDPRREDADGESAFVAESQRLRKEIETFLARESLLTLIAKKSLPAEASAEGDGAGEAASPGAAPLGDAPARRHGRLPVPQDPAAPRLVAIAGTLVTVARPPRRRIICWKRRRPSAGAGG